MSVRSTLLGLSILLASTATTAAEFSVVGPRATAMGGAGVATTTHPLALHWNMAVYLIRTMLTLSRETCLLLLLH